MRIVAGRFRGRPLRAPKGTRTRPTSDRVREAIFSMLHTVDGFRVLDLFAGTGAFGLEALSRGAEHATFVESGPPALAALRTNLAALDLQPSTYTLLSIPVARALTLLSQETLQFDVIFADPPYADAETALPSVLHSATTLLRPEGIAVLEHGPSTPPPASPSGLTCEKTRKYGSTMVSTYCV